MVVSLLSCLFLYKAGAGMLNDTRRPGRPITGESSGRMRMRRLVWSGSCLLALVVVYLLCPFRLGIVCGSSMEPTYHSGQPILIDQAYYQQRPVRRGDVILLRVGGETLIK